MLKPIFTQEDFDAADRSIEEAIREAEMEMAAARDIRREAAAPARAPLAHAAAPVDDGRGPRSAEAPPVRADTRIRRAEMPLSARLGRFVMMGGRARRIDLFNRIAATAEHGMNHGLQEHGKRRGIDTAGAIKVLLARSEPATSTERDLLVTLGRVQALVAMSCPGVTLRDLDAI